MEYKSLPSYTKEINGRAITGLASIFGVLDSYDDIVHPKSFKKTIKDDKSRFRHLWMHDAWEPPTAKIVDIYEVSKDDLPDDLLKKFPDATGGLEVVREYLDTVRGNEILEGVKSEAINEMSFGYDTIKSDFSDLDISGKNHRVRNLRELRLFDTSDVNWGANRATVASKALLDSELHLLISRIESLLEKKAEKFDLTKLQEALSILKDAEAGPSKKTPTLAVLKRIEIAERFYGG